ncbi:GntR family transcriptional regulator [Blastopirellula sp. J2-11]|uniref:GntR family transcriptional regulator n=1 Tax=Blastopirellula sp. J2-11 TaxID=2943192 RepID=UPI0021C5CCE1|nr:GntR family transcriptional regulator [Blastopirellula sp. J2-11]UUO06510.1 GntR family transcriptional regulator [Blastopirellula sp. J2-11]
MSISSPAHAATKAQRIFLDLRSKILSGEIESESRLTLRPLASDYESGINAVSEAIKALAAEGLVKLEGQAGARVIARDLKQIRGECILRIAIECESARRCAERADQSQLTILGNMAQQVDQLFEEGDKLKECRQADVRFHLTVAQFSGVPQLEDSLSPLLDRLVMLDQTEAQSDDHPGQKHLEVFDGLKTRKPQVAADAMRRHCEHSMNLSLALLY